MTDFPDGWVLTNLGRISEKPKYGWTTSAAGTGTVKLLRTTDITRGPVKWGEVPFCFEVPKELEKVEVKSGDIFISRTGVGVGTSALIGGEVPLSVFASYLIRIRIVEGVSRRFVRYFFLSPSYWNQISQISTGTAQPNVNAKTLQTIGVPLPPPAEQERIVEILEEQFSRLDSALASIGAVREKAGAFRRSLLHAAFSGELTGGMGGWQEVELSEIAKWSSGGTPRTKDPRFYGGNIPWCVIGDLTEGIVSITAQTITEEGLSASSAKVVPEGTVMIAMYGASIGRVGIAGLPMATNQAIACAQVDEGKASRWFLLHFLASQKKLFNAAGQGAAQPNISQTLLRSWLAPLPSVAEQERIVEILEGQFSRLESALDVVSQLEARIASQRRSLLHAAFSGELTANWRETHV